MLCLFCIRVILGGQWGSCSKRTTLYTELYTPIVLQLSSIIVESYILAISSRRMYDILPAPW